MKAHFFENVRKQRRSMDRVIFCMIIFVLLCYFPTLGYAQPLKTIKGTVVDNDEVPIPGVLVLVSGTTEGGVSDVDGNFSITAPLNSILEFSSLGYETQKFKVVKDMDKCQIVLQSQAYKLDELVVVGYGTIRKSDLSGSVNVIKTADLEDVPKVSADAMLQGRVAGLNMVTSSGAPGATTSVTIRGGNSITGSNEPLYVIDGMVMDNDAIMPSTGQTSTTDNWFNETPGLNPLARMNPNEIASIEVLKDASATAIYGSRGANGVVIITTKEGGKGAPKIEYSGRFGVTKITKIVPMLDSYEYGLFYNATIERAHQINDLWGGNIPIFQSRILQHNWLN